jgi:short-subunit dehydrogenase
VNIIIAGCGNVGFETAKLLSKEHKLLLIDLHQPQYIADFIKDKKNILFAQSDATDIAQMEKAVKTFTDRYHRIDALISTIGAFTEGTPMDSFQVFKKNFELNFFGNLVPIKSVIDGMIAARSGRLIIMSSTTGHHSPQSLVAYTPAKWALENLSCTLRSELLPYGITVDVISPASIKNRYSRTFISKYEIVEPHDIAFRIKSILQRPKNSNHFIPARYRMLHLVERMVPDVFDMRSGLKIRMKRARISRSLKVDSVLIVGASSDVGKKLAYLNSRSVKRLYLVDEDYESLQAVKGSIETMSECEVSIASMDLSDMRSIKNFTDGIKEVDLFINISRNSVIGSVKDIPVDLYRRDFDANFFGVLYLMAELFKKENKPKKVINVLSPIVIAGRRNYSSYACIMAAFWSITKSMRRIFGNELQVVEVISSRSTPAAQSLTGGSSSGNLFTGGSAVDAAALKIYGAEKKGKEIVVIPAKARLLLAMEALAPGLYNKVYT